MTDPHPDEQRTPKKLLFGRHLAPLLGPWIACTLIAAGILILEIKLPVFHEVVKILYFLLLVILIVVTGRWFSSSGGRIGRMGRVDRRRGERRQGKPDS